MSTDNEDKLSTGKRWKEERERLGLSRAVIATESCKTPQAIGEYERGVSWPGSEALVGFAKLGADVQYILTGVRAGASSKEGALSREEEAILDLFRGLNKIDRARARAMLDVLATPELMTKVG